MAQTDTKTFRKIEKIIVKIEQNDALSEGLKSIDNRCLFSHNTEHHSLEILM